MDLPGDVHGAPTVQIAQAFQQKCATTADGSERYKVGTTPYELVIGFQKDGKRTYKFEENGKPAALKPLNVIQGGSTVVVMFTDNSSLQIVDHGASAMIKYKDAQGKRHAVTPLTQTLQNASKIEAGKLTPNPCVS